MEAAYASEILLPAYQNNQHLILETSYFYQSHNIFTTHISSSVSSTDTFLSFL